MRSTLIEIYYFLLALEPRYKIVIFMIAALLITGAIMLTVVLRERSRKSVSKQGKDASSVW